MHSVIYARRQLQALVRQQQPTHALRRALDRSHHSGVSASEGATETDQENQQKEADATGEERHTVMPPWQALCPIAQMPAAKTETLGSLCPKGEHHHCDQRRGERETDSGEDRRSEERRVGKECRSRGAPYH